MVVGWIFGGDGCYKTSKGEDLSYKIGYFIVAALVCPVIPVCPDRLGLSVPISEVYLDRPRYELTSW